MDVRRPQLRTPAQNKHKSPNEEKYDEEDDNWDLPDVDIPYCWNSNAETSREKWKSLHPIEAGALTT